MRTRMGQTIVAAALVLALATPARAQQAPTLGAPPSPTVAPTTQVTTSSGGGGLKTWQEALIFVAGVALLAGIAIAIMADSRERARRVGHGGPATEPGAAPHRHKQRAKRRARAKGKAARAQRRRNR